jgi:ubiquinone/menaquinone biosynthesis C-methylase UbiE
MAAFYEWFARSGSLGQFQRFYRAVADAIDEDPGALLLDIGCGPGTLTPYLLPKVGTTGSVLGTDVSDEMIERGRALSKHHGWPNVRFQRSDARDFAPDQPAGIVVFCLSLTTMPEAGRVFSRALSWLKPGGQFVVLDSFIQATRRVARLAIRLKSPLVGADPDAISLADLTSHLKEIRTRHFHGGVYTLLSGRRPSVGTAAAQPGAAADEPQHLPIDPW